MDRAGSTGIVVTALVTACGVVVVLAVPALREAVGSVLGGDVEALRAQALDLGAVGALLLLALMLIHAVVFFPSELINAAAGYVYGFGLGLPLVFVGWTLSAIVAYWIGRAAGRPLLQRLAGPRRFERGESLVHGGGITALLPARLIPIVPFSAVGYVAGAARVPLWRYTWTTVVGSIPLWAAVVYLGHRLESVSLTDPGVLVAVGVFTALLVGGHLLARRVRA